MLALRLGVQADTWQPWGQVVVAPAPTGSAGAQLATDGTCLYYSTYLAGVYRATLVSHFFTPLPLTGFPLWDANTNASGLAVTAIAATPQGDLVIAGSPVGVQNNTIQFNPPGGSANAQPVFYWWDEPNQTWHPAAIAGKSYPYTGNTGNFSIATDGSLWTCSGFAPYAYRSTNGGRSYMALDINARLPASYFPLPTAGGLATVGEVFSIAAGWRGEVVIGTETAGFFHSTNQGLNWASLDTNFTNPASSSPLGRIGDARVLGWDRHGNFLLNDPGYGQYPGHTNWDAIPQLSWRPQDGALLPAATGLQANLGTLRILTTPAGVSLQFMNQNYQLQGGVYRSFDGLNWSQFNQGSGLDQPFAPGLTKALAAGNCLTAWSNQVFIAEGTVISSWNAGAPPLTNHPPVALPRNVNLSLNTTAALTLTGRDADGDSLVFTVSTPPTHGALTGTPPQVSYKPNSNYLGTDSFAFVVSDGAATSAVAVVYLAVNAPTNFLATVGFTSPAEGAVLVSPTNLNLVLTAAATSSAGIAGVVFYNSAVVLGVATQAPYSRTVTNLAAGEYTFFVRAVDKEGAGTWGAPIRVTVLPVAPTLAIAPAEANTVALTRPLELEGFFLETAPALDAPWTLVPVPPAYLPSGQTVFVPADTGAFYRLQHPR